MTDTMMVRVRYRRAKHVKTDNPEETSSDPQTLENMIRGVLKGSMGADVNSRVIKTVEDERHSICLHFHQVNQTSLVFDLLHLDDRKEIPTWKRPLNTVPISTLSGTKIGKDEVSLQEPAYVMVTGNHVAVIERVGMRTPAIENYLNEILKRNSSIDPKNSYWKLIPKIESVGVKSLKGGVEKIVFKPHAALVGEAATQTAKDSGKQRRYTRKIDEYIGYGGKIFEMLQIFGAHESDIEKLRKKMSSDLVLKAKVEISVSKAERSTEAKISADDIQTAFAHMTDGNEIEVIDRDGKTNGKLTQLSHAVEVAHENGIIDLKHAVSALGAAVTSWSAKGAIELE